MQRLDCRMTAIAVFTLSLAFLITSSSCLVTTATCNTACRVFGRGRSSFLSLRVTKPHRMPRWTGTGLEAEQRPPRYTRLYAASSSSPLNNESSQQQQRRQELLTRKGPFFELERRSGRIEFGATARLVTQLEGIYRQHRADAASTSSKTQSNEPDDDLEASIFEWLQDERGLALSIWDPKLMQERGNRVYRLQIMTLQFFTLTLAPWVDVQMQTRLVVPAAAAPTVPSQPQSQLPLPVFTVQSVSFEPNLQLAPGLRINADALGIVIEVAGSLQPSLSSTSAMVGGVTSKKGVSGTIAFCTTGILPPPLRLLPSSVLKATSDSINETIVKFAVQSFETGARTNFATYLRQRTARIAAAAAATPTTPNTSESGTAPSPTATTAL
jgi:Protein of unknown function (DUF1997)